MNIVMYTDKIYPKFVSKFYTDIFDIIEDMDSKTTITITSKSGPPTIDINKL